MSQYPDTVTSSSMHMSSIIIDCILCFPTSVVFSIVLILHTGTYCYKMATFHGEILPVISRAVDEEEEENASKPRDLVLKWSADHDQKALECDNLIIAAGEVAWSFLKIYYDLQNSDKVVEIIENSKEDDCIYEAISKQPNIVSTIYEKFNKQKRNIFVSCKSYIPPEQIWPWTAKFFNMVKPLKDVFVLSSSTIHEYKCEDMNSINTPFVRSLSTTTKPKNHPVFTVLEQPNLMKSIPAAIITHCQFQNIPATAYICYTENNQLDSLSIQAFTELLGTPQFKISVNQESVKQKIFNAVKNSNVGVGLYT
ncbi:proteasome assembly chaperone 1-like [Styela clava]